MTYSVTLRPGKPDEKKAAGLSTMNDIDRWVREEGNPGDEYEWEQPGRSGAGPTGKSVVP